MTKQQFREMVASGVLILDGATGSNLMKAGMPIGACPEQWVLENPEVLIQLQASYIEAGSKIVYAPTFTANRIKLAEYGLEKQVQSMNEQLVAISKKAIAKAGHRGYVAGDLTMTGQQLYPIGTLQFEELVDVYKEQVQALANAGADVIVAETIMSLAEARAALIATKEVCDLPVMVTLSFNEDGTTLFGTPPEVAVTVLQSLGADAVGVNCSTGPEEMIPIVKKMKEYATIPLIAKPNAGMPELIDGTSVYQMTPEEFALAGQRLVEAGANIVGGCCGTTPAHIESLSRTVKGMCVPEISTRHRSILTSERASVEIDVNGPFMVIGERINPTGKKALQAELREGKLHMVRTMAEEQEEHGADILDINMGMNGIDEKEMMLKTIYEVSNLVNLPLCIDSSHVDIIEAALRVYPGRALINSISLESEKIEKLLPIAKQYGAMFILLPLSDKGLPEHKEEKISIIHEILERAYAYGFQKEDIIVDGLVATVGANPNAAIETLETIAYCKQELQIATTCGLSNISFGLPERINVNTAFLTMAVANGLTMAILNPGQAMLLNAAYASDLLLHKEGADVRYIERMRTHAVTVTVANASVKETEAKDKGAAGEKPLVFEDVMKGAKGKIVDDVKAELAKGTKPGDIIDQYLIPAINEVGELFNQKIYFLPQLISSAETMELAITYLEPMLERKNQSKEMPTIIMATVEGDIHDIGKNLVVLMLKNYGYNVIDLGKDVPKEVIIEKAVETNAAVIGLSALMTTTMMRMKDVVEYAKERKVSAKIIIGGAVITQSFADEIGADGYSKDAAEAVRVVERLLTMK